MSTRSVSRRQFIKRAGLAVAGVTLTGAGLGVAATRTPAIAFPSVSLQGAPSVNERTLVTYATRAGSTAEIAAAIAETLAARVHSVDLKPVKEKPELAGYSAVVLGSAIRMGAWRPESMDFIKANQGTLNSMPVALFTVHMLNTGDDEASRAARAEYLSAVRPLLNAAEATYFEGRMDLSRLSFLDRTISKMVKAVEADHRDWDKIKGWAADLWS